MSLSRTCFTCNLVLLGPDSLAGTEIQCDCAVCLIMPAGNNADQAETSVAVMCPECSLQAEVKADTVGRQALCLVCRKKFDIQAPPVANFTTLGEDPGSKPEDLGAVFGPMIDNEPLAAESPALPCPPQTAEATPTDGVLAPLIDMEPVAPELPALPCPPPTPTVGFDGVVEPERDKEPVAELPALPCPPPPPTTLPTPAPRKSQRPIPLPKVPGTATARPSPKPPAASGATVKTKRRGATVHESSDGLEVAELYRRGYGKAVFLLLLLFASVGASVAVVKLRPHEPDFIRFLPDHCQLVAVLDAEALRARPAFELLCHPFDAADALAWEKRWGLTPTQVVRVVAARDRLGQRMVFQVRTNTSVTAADLLTHKRAEDYPRSYCGPHEVFLGKDEAFCVVDAHTVIYGEPATLRALLGRNGTPSLAAEFKEALTRVDFSQGAALVAAADGLAEQKLTLARADLTQVLRNLPKKVKTVTVQGHWDSHLKTTITLHGPGLESVADLKEWLDARPSSESASEFGDLLRVLQPEHWSVATDHATAALDIHAQVIVQALLYELKPATYWMTVLQEGNASDRKEAAERLVALGPKAVPEVGLALRNEKRAPSVRIQCTRILAHSPDAKEGVRALVEALHAKDDSVRQAAAEALALVGPAASAARIPLLETLGDAGPPVRQAAAVALAKLGEPALNDVVSLCGVLKNPSPAMWHKVVLDLGNVAAQYRNKGPLPACLLERLLQGLGRGDEVRLAAKESLQKIRPFTQDDLTVLCQALKDEHVPVAVKQYVAEALGCYAADSSLARTSLVDAVKQPGDLRVRLEALKALGVMRPKQPEVLEAILAVFPEKELAAVAAQTLGLLRPTAQPGTQKAVLLLAEGLRGQDQELRIKAAVALGEIGKPALLALPMLERARMQPDKELSRQAETALHKIGKPAREDVKQLLKVLQDRSARQGRAYALQILVDLGPMAQEALSTLVEVLAANADNQLRRLSARALGTLGPADAADNIIVAALAKALGDHDREVRVAACWALQKFGRRAELAVVPLSAAVRAEDGDFRLAALRALAAVGPPGNAAVSAILPTLRDPDSFVRRQAVLTLAAVGADGKETISALAGALRDSDKLVRTGSAKRLAKIGRPAVDTLAKALKDKDSNVRLLVLEALMEIGWWDKDSVTTLTDLLRTDDALAVRLAAAKALAGDGLPNLKQAVPALLDALADKANTKEMRHQVARTLRTVAASAPDAKKELARLLWVEDPEVCKELRAALKSLKLDTKEYVFLLVGAFRNPSEEVQAQLLEDMKTLGQNRNLKEVSAPTIRVLTEQLGHESDIVRLGVVRSLGAIGPAAIFARKALEMRYYQAEPNPIIRDALEKAILKVKGTPTP